MTLSLFDFEEGLADWFAHFISDKLTVLLLVFLEDLRQNFKFLVPFCKLIHCEGGVGLEPVLCSLDPVVEIDVFDVVERSEKSIVLRVEGSIQRH